MSLLCNNVLKPDNEWLTSFRERYGIDFETIADEAMSAPVQNVTFWKQREKVKIKKCIL